MSSERRADQARGDLKKPVDDQAWTATFTFLDASGTISASQLRRLAGGIARMWRRVISHRPPIG